MGLTLCWPIGGVIGMVSSPFPPSPFPPFLCCNIFGPLALAYTWPLYRPNYPIFRFASLSPPPTHTPHINLENKFPLTSAAPKRQYLSLMLTWSATVAAACSGLALLDIPPHQPLSTP